MRLIVDGLASLWHSFPLLSILVLLLHISLLSLKIGLVMLVLHYMYYTFVWKRFFSKSPRRFDQYLKERDQDQIQKYTPSRHRRSASIPPLGKPAIFGDEPIENFLSSVLLFTYLEPIVAEQIAQASEEIIIKAGESIGLADTGSMLYVYILKRGRFKISSPAVGDASVVLSNPGDFLNSLFEIIGLITGVQDKELFVKSVEALQDSTVIRIPGAVIKERGLARPAEVHNAVRVILTRFQRIICSSLFSHFGLIKELFRIDQVLSVHGAPRTPPSQNEARGLLMDALLKHLGIPEKDWESLISIIDMETDMKAEFMSESGQLAIDGIFLVVSGRVSVCLEGSGECRFYGSHSLFGSFSSIFGARAVSVCTALEQPTTLMHLSQTALMKLFEKEPKCYMALTKLIIPQLSPLVCFLDMNLEWLHINAGLAICEARAPADSLYIVIHGRLRSAIMGGNGETRILSEIGPGESHGESELFQDLNWPGTLFAVRDSELVRVPKDLFDLLVKSNSEASLRMAKVIANRTNLSVDPMRAPRIATVKTLAILPNCIAASNAAELLCKRLHSAISRSEPCTILSKSTAISALGKHAFTAYGKLKLMEWLNRQEDMYRVVIYFADTPASPWTQRCLRQADCVFVVADAREEPIMGEYEHSLLAIPNMVRSELILVHPSHHCPAGLTRRWLQSRPWVVQHHHILLHTKDPATSGKSGNWRLTEMNWAILADQLMTQGFRRTLRSFYSPTSEPDSSGQDIERLARRVMGTGVGLVLGGGGARGIAHIGVISALQREGIPIDAIGGTSIGALVGGLFARDANIYTSTALLRVFSALMSSKWRLAYDLTYPFCAWFTGESFNRALWKIFEERLIEDMWLPYFCITTDISTSKMTVHKEALAWRYIRASMSLSGFLPPLWDEGNSLLLDGGYTNNLPVDVMIADNPYLSTVIAVDVGAERGEPDEYYHDDVSGLALLVRRIFGRKVNVPSLADIQSRLAYVSCVDRIKRIKELASDPESSGIHYLRPPVQSFATLEFDKFERISKIGEAYATDLLSNWKQDGTLEKLKASLVSKCPAGMDYPESMIDFADGPVDKSCIRRRRRSL